ncbi:unnamed protein product [Prorocentrum cordatum]|uniref:Protein kinase domain-containing protein n=1 Tax=Prorocentrum cordatum TaxID=2364126 RepID=A0ABN9Q5J6_9DINO|nr:unnamed protein product [Polarella glacialis]
MLEMLSGNVPFDDKAAENDEKVVFAALVNGNPWSIGGKYRRSATPTLRPPLAPAARCRDVAVTSLSDGVGLGLAWAGETARFGRASSPRCRLLCPGGFSAHAHRCPCEFN